MNNQNFMIKGGGGGRGSGGSGSGGGSSGSRGDDFSVVVLQ